tara:strand:- start:355 stop:525 length:171 start_codon:yes stop_codon:yes gene_type:complete
MKCGWLDRHVSIAIERLLKKYQKTLDMEPVLDCIVGICEYMDYLMKIADKLLLEQI